MHGFTIVVSTGTGVIMAMTLGIADAALLRGLHGSILVRLRSAICVCVRRERERVLVRYEKRNNTKKQIINHDNIAPAFHQLS